MRGRQSLSKSANNTGSNKASQAAIFRHRGLIRIEARPSFPLESKQFHQMISDFGVKIDSWEDFCELIAFTTEERWARSVCRTHESMYWSGTLIMTLGMFRGLVPRSLENMCYVIDELPDAYLCGSRLDQRDPVNTAGWYD